MPLCRLSSMLGTDEHRIKCWKLTHKYITTKQAISVGCGIFCILSHIHTLLLFSFFVSLTLVPCSLHARSSPLAFKLFIIRLQKQQKVSTRSSPPLFFPAPGLSACMHAYLQQMKKGSRYATTQITDFRPRHADAPNAFLRLDQHPASGSGVLRWCMRVPKRQLAFLCGSFCQNASFFSSGKMGVFVYIDPGCLGT